MNPPATAAPDADRLTIISSDCHAGAQTATYRDYLQADYLDEFDAWREKYSNPFSDLTTGVKNRNWDFERRTSEQYADGVVAEVVFPNTVPPFFPTGQLIANPPKPGASYQRRLAGIRAHNRWLVDFCAELPGQRIGLPQIFLQNPDDAIADVKWAAEAGFSSVLMPAVPPDADIEPLYSDVYNDLWAVCQDHDIVITQHGGGGLPNYKGHPATAFFMLMEVKFFTNRSVWHMILSGVFERFPKLKYVMTEQGIDWLPDTLGRMDDFWHQVQRSGRVGELQFKVDEMLSIPPSEYFKRNCWVGASFPAPGDVEAMRWLGLDRVMWGSDYPHDEGTYPDSVKSLRRTFTDWSDDELRQVLSGNAASVYRADLDALAPVAAQYGPTIDELKQPLDEIPENDSPAFQRP